MALSITIAAIGRLKSAPEQQLIDHYLKGCGWQVRWRELLPKKTETAARMREEALLLGGAVADCQRVLALDERGEVMDSPQLSGWLTGLEDCGVARLGVLIGGADGLDAALRQSADARLSFGRLTWPHMLVRVMLAEQLYRAWSIGQGHPYHRG